MIFLFEIASYFSRKAAAAPASKTMQAIGRGADNGRRALGEAGDRSGDLDFFAHFQKFSIVFANACMSRLRQGEFYRAPATARRRRELRSRPRTHRASAHRRSGEVK